MVADTLLLPSDVLQHVYISQSDIRDMNALHRFVQSEFGTDMDVLNAIVDNGALVLRNGALMAVKKFAEEDILLSDGSRAKLTEMDDRTFAQLKPHEVHPYVLSRECALRAALHIDRCRKACRLIKEIWCKAAHPKIISVVSSVFGTNNATIINDINKSKEHDLIREIRSYVDKVMALKSESFLDGLPINVLMRSAERKIPEHLLCRMNMRPFAFYRMCFHLDVSGSVILMDKKQLSSVPPAKEYGAIDWRAYECRLIRYLMQFSNGASLHRILCECPPDEDGAMCFMVPASAFFSDHAYMLDLKTINGSHHVVRLKPCFTKRFIYRMLCKARRASDVHDEDIRRFPSLFAKDGTLHTEVVCDWSVYGDAAVVRLMLKDTKSVADGMLQEQVDFIEQIIVGISAPSSAYCRKHPSMFDATGCIKHEVLREYRLRGRDVLVQCVVGDMDAEIKAFVVDATKALEKFPKGLHIRYTKNICPVPRRFLNYLECTPLEFFRRHAGHFMVDKHLVVWPLQSVAN